MKRFTPIGDMLDIPPHAHGDGYGNLEWRVKNHRNGCSEEDVYYLASEADPLVAGQDQTIAARDLEIAELQRDISNITSVWHEKLQAAEIERDAARAELAAAKANDARYKWIRRGGIGSPYYVADSSNSWMPVMDEALDAAIDSSIAADGMRGTER